MEWNVYIEDFNSRKIKIFNVFSHGRFKEDVATLLNNENAFEFWGETFSDKLRHMAAYYFGYKCEYETVLTSWPPYVDKEEIQRLAAQDVKYRTDVRLTVGEKISVYDQLLMNWDVFVKYIKEVTINAST